MKPLLDPSFWSDPEIEAAAPEVKLAALWLITNSQTSLLGVCGASLSRFRFETGLGEEALQSALEALPRSLMRIGSAVFVRNYIRHQFGTGEKLMKNNFFVALKSLFLSIKDEVMSAAILKEYPEFEEARKGFKGLAKPKDSKGEDGKGKELPEMPEPLAAVDGFAEVWPQFIQHRKEIKKTLTPLAAVRILNSLCERPREAIFALETAIRRSWQGFEWEWVDREKPKAGTGAPNEQMPSAFRVPMTKPPQRPAHLDDPQN